MTKKRDYTLGAVLILIGVVILLANQNLALTDLLIVAIGTVLLIRYYTERNSFYLVLGMIMLVIGGSSLVESHLSTSIDLEGFMFMTGLGVVFLILYFTKKISGFIYPACFLMTFGIFILIKEVFTVDMDWAFFIAVGGAFYMIYFIETRKYSSKWPLIPGTILIALSGLFYLMNHDIIKDNFGEIITYAWPVILILIGIRIIYNNIRHK
ncbi:MAG: hypothetical protein FH761_00055 [Firmicutes bacterium]|nr:hypothetical protein [Bacillota bacterium]